MNPGRTFPDSSRSPERAEPKTAAPLSSTYPRAPEAPALHAEGLISLGAVHDSANTADDLDELPPVAGMLRVVLDTGQAFEHLGGTWVFRGDVYRRAAPSVAALTAYAGGPGARREVEGAGGPPGAFRWTKNGDLPGAVTLAQGYTLGLVADAAAGGYWRREHERAEIHLGWAEHSTDAQELLDAAMAYATARPGTTVRVPNTDTRVEFAITAPVTVPAYTRVVGEAGPCRVRQTASLTPGLVPSSYAVIEDIELVGVETDYYQSASTAGRPAGYDAAAGVLIQGTDEERIQSVTLRNLRVTGFGSRQVSIQHADDTLIEGGVYTGPAAYDARTNRGGVRVGGNNSPCIVVASHATRTTLRGVRMTGGTFGYLQGTRSVRDTSITGCTIHDIYGQHGVYVSGDVDGLVVNGCTIRDCANHGVKTQQSAGSTRASRGIVLSSLSISGTGTAAVILTSTDRALSHLTEDAVVTGVTIDMGDAADDAVVIAGCRSATVDVSVRRGRRGVSLRSSSQCSITVHTAAARREGVYAYLDPDYASADGQGRAIGVGNRIVAVVDGAAGDTPRGFDAVKLNGQAGAVVDLDVYHQPAAAPYAGLDVIGGDVTGSVRVRGPGEGAAMPVACRMRRGARALGLVTDVISGLVTALLTTEAGCSGRVSVAGESQSVGVQLTDSGDMAVDLLSTRSGVHGVYALGTATVGPVTLTGSVAGAARSCVLTDATLPAAVEVRVIGLDAAGLSSDGSHACLDANGGALVVRRSAMRTSGARVWAVDASAGVSYESTFNDFGALPVRYTAAGLVRDAHNVQGTVTAG